jgi:adenylylsulfate kinase-like enzyme
MKTKLISIFLVIAFLSITFLSSDLIAQKKRTSSKPIKGQVVSLNDLVLNGKGRITKDQAKELAEQGNPIVFLSGKTVYFVYNEDGSFAGKKLANYANNEVVGIVGKTKKVNGLNILIASIIESM